MTAKYVPKCIELANSELVERAGLGEGSQLFDREPASVLGHTVDQVYDVEALTAYVKSAFRCKPETVVVIEPLVRWEHDSTLGGSFWQRESVVVPETLSAESVLVFACCFVPAIETRRTRKTALVGASLVGGGVMWAATPSLVKSLPPLVEGGPRLTIAQRAAEIVQTGSVTRANGLWNELEIARPFQCKLLREAVAETPVADDVHDGLGRARRDSAFYRSYFEYGKMMVRIVQRGLLCRADVETAGVVHGTEPRRLRVLSPQFLAATLAGPICVEPPPPPPPPPIVVDLVEEAPEEPAAPAAPRDPHPFDRLTRQALGVLSIYEIDRSMRNRLSTLVMVYDYYFRAGKELPEAESLQSDAYYVRQYPNGPGAPVRADFMLGTPPLYASLGLALACLVVAPDARMRAWLLQAEYQLLEFRRIRCDDVAHVERISEQIDRCKEPAAESQLGVLVARMRTDLAARLAAYDDVQSNEQE